MISNYKIVTKNIFTDAEHKQIDELNKICCAHDGIYLKLELEFKKQVKNVISGQPENINEFLCYDGSSMIGYASILSFDPKEAEITGMVHPEYRRRGVFTSLFAKVIDRITSYNVCYTKLLRKPASFKRCRLLAS